MDTNTYALITPDGELVFKTGVPDQMWKDADPHFGAQSGFTLSAPTRQGSDGWGSAHGMRGYVGDCSALPSFREKYAPNPAAQYLVTALGGPFQRWFGNLVLCGSELIGDIGELDLCGLTEEQQDLIRGLHQSTG